jgi:GNAT superfamily N-acetyltransferase
VIDYRPIGAADMDSCVEVFINSDEALTVSFNLPLMPRNQAALTGIFNHVCATTPSRAWLAEEDSQVVGFGMSAERGDLVFLSFLFVLPAYQARGIGRELYERCVPRSGRRATCIWSIQPVSAALYARDGLVPRVPIYTFLGRPRNELPQLASYLSLTSIELHELDELDAEVVDLTRTVDHRKWQSWERQAFGLRDGSDLVGYGYAQPSGRLGPVIVRREEDLLPLVGELMRHFDPPGDWMVHVPGPAAETFAHLLQAGMRFDGAPTIFCATDARIDHSRYLPGSFGLP